MKYTVHLMTPSLTWYEVEADDEKEAIRKCALVGSNIDHSTHDAISWVATEEDA